MMNQSSVNIQLLSTLCRILRRMLDAIPTISSNAVAVIIAQLHSLRKTLIDVDGIREFDKQMTEIDELCIEILGKIHKGILTKQRSQITHNADDLEPLHSFRSLPIFPVRQDFRCDVEPFLRANKVCGQYRDVEHYLDVQFRLLREDLIIPLRQGINQLKHRDSRSRDKKPIQDMYVYTGVKYQNISCTDNGIVVTFLFDVSHIKHVKWKKTKRLLYGSLVCLSMDNFDTFVTGTVEDRAPEQLSKGIVTILISGALGVDYVAEYTMVEGSAYYEAYRHNLEGLKEFSENTLPLKEYILNTRQLDVDLPRYMRTRDVKLDFTSILQSKKSSEKSPELGCWPSAEELGLDESQYEALRIAFNREFAIIQGPPGTGKTFIGLRIVKLLLNNLAILQPREDQRPILLVCYTNHALDQFLEGILHSERMALGDVVRVGRRSKSEKLQECQMNILKRNKIYQRRNVGDIRYQMRDLNGKLVYIDASLKESRELILQYDEIKNSMCQIHQMWFEQTQLTIEEWLEHIPGRQIEDGQYFKKGDRVLTAFKTKQELIRSSYLTPNEEASIEQLWMLSTEKRWELYRLWRQRYIYYMTAQFTAIGQEYQVLSKRLIEARRDDDYNILRGARIIGMTTTAAAKHRHILQRIGSRIVIVEEAAEVLEAHIITSLSTHCEHLIMIGDHQQLRPNPAVYTLAKRYNLEISLFERMVKNGMHCASLQIQHRMRPDIVKLIVPHVYKSLQNAESVMNYENIRGINGNLFFIQHKHRESSTYDTRSRSNDHEASYVKQLCKYLIQQGYSPSKITILTTYTGQMFEIRKYTRQDELTSSVLVTPVDNYQGEENDIILLSLVRSNQENDIGFLKTSNRVCVALSRAKKALYVIGDMDSMRKSSPMWANIINDVQAANRLVDGLPLYCQNHPKTGIVAVTPTDFDRAPNGGCKRQCEFRLNCGHVCAKLCHVQDSKHTDYWCLKPCARTCSNNHPCNLRCNQQCQACPELVPKTMQECGHTIQIACYRAPYIQSCTAPCEKTIPCGHKCPNKCGEVCLDPARCRVVVPGRSWPCGHKSDVECFKTPDKYPCQFKLSRTLPCGHVHRLPCNINMTTYICSQPCDTLLSCGLKCSRECNEPCSTSASCRVMVVAELSCGHSVTKKCSEQLEYIQCRELVDLELCSRKCRNTIHCYEVVEYRQHGCRMEIAKTCAVNPSHVFNVICCEEENAPCTSECRGKLPCGHFCTAQCGECSKSKIHAICESPCERFLPCKHQCSGICGEPCSPCQCISKEKRCRHPKNQYTFIEVRCTEPCLWQCKHQRCNNLCTQPCIREPCNVKCPERLMCGHRCPGYCGEPCPRICTTCDEYYFKQITRKLGRVCRGERYVLVMPCYHALPRSFMDKYVAEYMENIGARPRRLTTFECPLCGKLIRYCCRYDSAIQESDRVIEKINQQMATNRRLWKNLCISNRFMLQQIRQGWSDPQYRSRLTMSLGALILLSQISAQSRFKFQNENWDEHNDYIKEQQENCRQMRREIKRAVLDMSYQSDMAQLVWTVKLLWMNTLIHHYRNKAHDSRLLQVLSDNSKSPRDRFHWANAALIKMTTLQERNGANSFVDSADDCFSISVGALSGCRIQWVECRNGHIYSDPVNTRLMDSHCCICDLNKDLTAPSDAISGIDVDRVSDDDGDGGGDDDGSDDDGGDVDDNGDDDGGDYNGGGDDDGGDYNGGGDDDGDDVGGEFDDYDDDDGGDEGGEFDDYDDDDDGGDDDGGNGDGGDYNGGGDDDDDGDSDVEGGEFDEYDDSDGGDDDEGGEANSTGSILVID